MPKMLNIAVVALALANTAFAATAWFYSQTDCAGNKVVGACTNLPENKCCTDRQVCLLTSLSWCRATSDVPHFPSQINPANVWGAEIAGIGSNRAVLALNNNGKCLGVTWWKNAQCQTTGTNDIFGTYWTAASSKRSALTTECNGVQHFDIYNIAFPGKERKPYSAALAEQFSHVDAVDWTTRTFKADKVDVVQDIITQHGHGLTDAQLAAISERFNQ